MFVGLARNLAIIFGRKEEEKKPTPIIKIWVSIIITFLLLGVGLYVILGQDYDASVKKWAFGVVGAIIGYWLKD